MKDNLDLQTMCGPQPSEGSNISATPLFHTKTDQIIIKTSEPQPNKKRQHQKLKRASRFLAQFNCMDEAK